MPKTVTATGAKRTLPYLPTDVPPNKARKKKTAGGPKKMTGKKAGGMGY